MAALRRQQKKLGLPAFGKKEPEAPELPSEASHLWVAFCALDATRGGGMGPGPISFAEIEAYARLHGFAWAPVEVELLRALDIEYLTHQAQKRPVRVVAPPKKTVAPASHPPAAASARTLTRPSPRAGR